MPVIGAEVRGVDLAQPLGDAAFAAIERAYDEHGVIFFRNQRITPPQQVAFTRRFGEIEFNIFGERWSVPGSPEIVVVSNITEDGRPVGVRRRQLETEHPIVRVHPETGERVLFVSPSFLKTIVGLTARESEVMLDLLWEHVVRPEYTVRFKWEAGDIAMWDNRATSHLAPTDIFDSDFDRQLYRITLVGDVPVGVDGRPSVAIKGEPILAVETELTAAAG